MIFIIFIFIRLSRSHKLGWVPSGFAQFSSICFWSFFKIKYFSSSTFLHFFLELGFIILVICFQLDSFVHMIWLARFRGLTWVRWCFIFSGFFCWLIFYYYYYYSTFGLMVIGHQYFFFLFMRLTRPHGSCLKFSMLTRVD